MNNYVCVLVKLETIPWAATFELVHQIIQSIKIIGSIFPDKTQGKKNIDLDYPIA